MFESYSIGDVLGIFGRCCILALLRPRMIWSFMFGLEMVFRSLCLVVRTA